MATARVILIALCISLGVNIGGFSAEKIGFKTKYFRFDISPDGTSAALIDLRDGKDYISPHSLPIADITIAGKRHNASAVRREGDRLRVSFEDCDITATIRVREKEKWLVFELEGLSSKSGVEEVTFLQLPVDIIGEERIAAPQAGCVRNSRFAVCCQTLNDRTVSWVIAGPRRTVLFGRCFSRFGFKGGRVALFAAPTEEILGVIEAVELGEGLPHPTLDGVWARISPDAFKSYLFIDMTEQNADEIINIAGSLNFGYILIYAPKWGTTLGSYKINKKTYPHGMKGLKKVADKAHAVGLKVGIHCLTGFVNKRDPLVTPVPDRRLCKDAQATLAEDIDEKATFIPTVNPPSDFVSDVGFGLERQGFDVQIDDEIIIYRGLSTREPYGLLNCVRGAHGTRRARHKKGATVWHLTQRFGNYLADCETDLADEIAKRYADVINECGLDMIYFDGAASYIAYGKEWTWHYVPYIPLRSARMWKREVRVGGSCSGPLYWHLRCFATCNDFVEIAVKRFCDENKLRSAEFAARNFIPADIGWWGLHTWAPHRRATTPDEIEYVCQKALAHNAFWSLETTLEKIKTCGRWDEIKNLIARYEKLRLEKYFPEKVKQAVREKGAEFKLIGSDEEGWRLVPARYDPPHLVVDERSAAWTVDNDLPAQPLRFRLYALPELAPYDSPDNPVLLSQEDMSRYVKKRTRAGCETTLSPSDEKTPQGEPCVAFSAVSKLKNDSGWVEHRADLVKIGERAVFPTLIEGEPEDITLKGRWARPLGVWVKGDGKGEVLNIQLRSANGGYRDHYIDINFTGWKYCELTRPETDRVFEFKAGYDRKIAVRHFQYGKIRFVYLRYNSIPANTEVCCLVGPVKALRERWLPMRNPTFIVNGVKVVFPCTLRTEQYLEFMGEGKARLFDRNGFQIGEVKPSGKIPVLKRGRNEIRFSAERGQKYSRRAEITIIRFGE